MITEVLTHLIQREESWGNIHGIRIARNAPLVSNIFFADDLMLFCRANSHEVQHLQTCLSTFSSWSGQEINASKSFVHFNPNMAAAYKEHLSHLLQIQPASGEGKYLGLPLEVPRSKLQACKDLQDRLDRHLAGWKARLLSQAGSTTLIQSVAMALPSCYSLSSSSLNKCVGALIQR